MKKLTSVSYRDVVLKDGFWKKWLDTVTDSTVDAVYEQFEKTGRVNAMTLNWREGEPNRPHIFYDSDIAKWMEGAAYTLRYKKNAELEDTIDAIVNLIEDGMSAEGYFNSYYQTVEPSNRWTNRHNHELYCAGHLMEAAVAYYEVTGKKKFLELMERYADYIEAVFVTTQSAKFYTPGHEEIELALVKMYRTTGEERYLKLAKYFIDMRGQKDEKLFDFFRDDPRYAQDQNPVREQQSAEGHVVRCGYLFSGAADVAWETGDEALLEACQRIFTEAMTTKMYITGGVGNMKHGEAFGPRYFLPNFEAYTETCASLAFAFLARRILNADPDSRYADNMERQLYNGALAGISLDGKHFFYENPLEQKPSDLTFLHDMGANGRPAERVRVFSCSCCPPNILRTLASIGDYFYSTDGKTLYTHLYGASRTKLTLDGKPLTIVQSTKYPEDGKITVRIQAKEPIKATLAFRIPGWCKKPLVTCGGKAPDRIEKGYACFEKVWQDGDKVELNFRMEVRMMEADPRVYADCGKIALMRGPLVYCLEEADNGKNLCDIRIAQNPCFKVTYQPNLLNGITAITFKGSHRKEDFGGSLYREYTSEREEATYTAVPYYAWCNRGEGEMTVWIQR